MTEVSQNLSSSIVWTDTVDSLDASASDQIKWVPIAHEFPKALNENADEKPRVKYVWFRRYADGTSPVLRWFKSLNQTQKQSVKDTFVAYSLGLPWASKTFGSVTELRDCSGLRVYGFVKDDRFVALVAGDKDGQEQDILDARRLIDEYKK